MSTPFDRKGELYMIRHLIAPFHLTYDETRRVLDTAASIEQNRQAYAHVADGKRLATLFYEPSTRTRLSHEAAMQNLGGNVIGFPSADVSSVSKGETIEDTIRVISCYADIAAMRHPQIGSAALAAEYSAIPVINAGDGAGDHPTQTLLDLYTIRKRLGRLHDITIGFCGDLKFGRTVHSLVKSLSRERGIRFVFISPAELSLPEELLETYVKANDIPYTVCTDLQEAIGGLDVLYMTRIQEERFASRDEYLGFKGLYILDADKMKAAKEQMAVLHPFPRVDEIDPAIDSDPRTAYFEQVQNGVFVRMAVIMALLHIPDPLTGEQILTD